MKLWFEPESMPDWWPRKTLVMVVCAALGHAYERHVPDKEVRCVRCKLMR